MSKFIAVPVPGRIWAELAEEDLTPLPVLGDMSRWVSQYSFPYWQTRWEERCLTLERRGQVGEDRWALLDKPYCYNKRTGQWEYEMRNSERSDRFLNDCRLTLAEARPVLVRELVVHHSHCLRTVARTVALREIREAERAQIKIERQHLANALGARLKAQEGA